jgi:TetR/AcrR family transcriptional regulator, transcriptional repressor for nem operon
MKVTREQAAENRERIIRNAARLFREKGFDGIGVAELMKSAGLTHGGFYGHFASKSDLAAKACEAALAKSEAKWAALAETPGPEALKEIVESYLSETHRDQPGSGCMLPALAPDACRQDPAVKHALTDGLKALVAILETTVCEGSEETRRKTALAAMAQMVGAVVLSRMVDDEALSKDILDAVTDDIVAAGH